MDCFQNAGGITVYFVFRLLAFTVYLPLWVPPRAGADSFCLLSALTDSLIHSFLQSFHKDELQGQGK